MCGVVIGNYSVRYQLRSGAGGSTTVNTSSTSVTLQDLVPNAEYTVSVAAINSAGELSAYTETTQFELQGDLWMFKCCVPRTVECHIRPHTHIQLGLLCMLFSLQSPNLQQV